MPKLLIIQPLFGLISTLILLHTVWLNRVANDRRIEMNYHAVASEEIKCNHHIMLPIARQISLDTVLDSFHLMVVQSRS